MFTSQYPKLEIPDVGVSAFLFDTLEVGDLDRVAVIDPRTGTETTYGQLRAQVNALAGALAARGVGVGTVMALLCPNIPAYITAIQGMLRAGATVTTVNTLYGPDEIEAQLIDSQATWMVTISPLLPQCAAAAARVGIPGDRIVVIDGAPGHPDLRGMIAEGRGAPEVHFDPATHVALMPYSSGTTGFPKGVLMSDRNIVANTEQTRIVLGPTTDDRVHAVMPFFHVYGLIALMTMALRGRAAIVPMARFDFVEFLSDLQRHRCTVVVVAPPIVVGLAKHPAVEQFDLSSVTVVYSGAAPLDAATAERASARVGAPLLQGFGMSELSAVASAIPRTRGDLPANAVGFLLPSETCRIVDTATGAEITEFGDDGWTAPGELWVAGPNVMLGYLGNPEATAATVDADGFLHTGDVARVHRDGYLAIVERVKELIKYHGHQVAPAELEAILLGHPQIADAAVIGVQDAEGEEFPKAFVVLAPGAQLDADDVMAYVAERVEPHKKVREVEFIDVVPKSAAGKILRKDLRQREAASA
ncbi:AMP-binding protein [Microbacterium mangrovi]|uniref:AMP-binding protein n=1 Tax=Microbacterium mangrovi TaxID=1348253 RepID=UPI0009DEEC5F|nr:AMP-binding protein [Microbacterium mangrovi]